MSSCNSSANFNAPSEMKLDDLINPLRAVLDLSAAIRTGFEESFKRDYQRNNEEC